MDQAWFLMRGPEFDGVLFGQNRDPHENAQHEADIDFTVHAREDLPWAIAVIRRQAEELIQLRARLIFVGRGYLPNAWDLVDETIRQDCPADAARGLTVYGV